MPCPLPQSVALAEIQYRVSEVESEFGMITDSEADGSRTISRAESRKTICLPANLVGQLKEAQFEKIRFEAELQPMLVCGLGCRIRNAHRSKEGYGWVTVIRLSGDIFVVGMVESGGGGIPG